ncbi:MAG: DUF6051 family protein, partial [Spirochaetales bacterium]|nr:DUF6051 family protein [Spirochaetales bacterium]
NTALSHRLQFAPHRFFCSGIQTYYDILNFINEVKLGIHPFLDKDCQYDFFSYSIGSTLTEVLLTSNYNGYFDNSRAFLFCGGAALDTTDPVCKTIMDKEAHSELFRWLATLFESVTDMSRRVKEIFFQELPEVLNFKSFLFYEKMQSYRELTLKNNSSKIRGLCLKKDQVFPMDAAKKTLNGFYNDIDIKMDIIDFPYEYKHEEPFPATEKNRDEVDKAFNEVLTAATDFFNRSA